MKGSKLFHNYPSNWKYRTIEACILLLNAEILLFYFIVCLYHKIMQQWYTVCTSESRVMKFQFGWVRGKYFSLKFSLLPLPLKTPPQWFSIRLIFTSSLVLIFRKLIFWAIFPLFFLLREEFLVNFLSFN